MAKKTKAPPLFEQGDTATKDAGLMLDVLHRIIDAYHKSNWKRIAELGCSRRTAAALANMSAIQLRRLAENSAVVSVSFDKSALANMVTRFKEEEEVTARQHRWLRLDAPVEMMTHCFGLDGHDVAQMRKELGVTGKTGRPLKITDDEKKMVLRSYQALEGYPPEFRYETVAMETGLSLRVIWPLIRRWEQEKGPLKADDNVEVGSKPTPVIVQPPPATALQALWQRYTQRADSEHEQALIRLFLVVLFVLFAFWMVPNHPNDFFVDPRVPKVLVYAVGPVSVALSLSIIAAILYWPSVVLWRRRVGLIHDIVVASILWAALDGVGLVLYFIYQWVLIGNAFRFGPKTLFLGLPFALV